MRLRSAELFCRKVIVVAMIKIIEISIYKKERKKYLKKKLSRHRKRFDLLSLVKKKEKKDEH